eukprot:m.46495 g.46495  ORF g.46495 m.46495 type:complete len:281 (-) comp7270_c0_seq2:86-928(-)
MMGDNTTIWFDDGDEESAYDDNNYNTNNNNGGNVSYVQQQQQPPPIQQHTPQPPPMTQPVSSTFRRQQPYPPVFHQQGSSSHNTPYLIPQDPIDSARSYSSDDADDDDEEPLLEELGVNFSHILDKTKAVLNLYRPVNDHLMDDTDLAGPLLFCIAYSSFLLLRGKVEFSAVYGVALIGTLGLYFVLTMMSQSPESSVSLSRTASVLGYSLLPMVALSSIAILLNLTGFLGTILAFISIAWCTHSASRIFSSVLHMSHQNLLVAYPCALLYGVFALLTVF